MKIDLLYKASFIIVGAVVASVFFGGYIFVNTLFESKFDAGYTQGVTDVLSHIEDQLKTQGGLSVQMNDDNGEVQSIFLVPYQPPIEENL